MPDFYWTGANSNSWSDAANWFEANLSTPKGAAPSNGDSVYLTGSTAPTDGATISLAVFDSTGLTATLSSTVTSGITIQSGGTLAVGDSSFNSQQWAGTYNSSSITAAFHGNAACLTSGTASTATFDGSAYLDFGLSLTAAVTASGSAAIYGGVVGDVVLNNSAVCRGDVTGNITSNAGTQVQPNGQTITGDISLTGAIDDNATGSAAMTVTGNVIVESGGAINIVNDQVLTAGGLIRFKSGASFSAGAIKGNVQIDAGATINSAAAIQGNGTGHKTVTLGQNDVVVDGFTIQDSDITVTGGGVLSFRILNSTITSDGVGGGGGGGGGRGAQSRLIAMGVS